MKTDSQELRERFLGALRYLAGLQSDPRLSIDNVMAVFDYVQARPAAEPPTAAPLPSEGRTGYTRVPGWGPTGVLQGASVKDKP